MTLSNTIPVIKPYTGLTLAKEGAGHINVHHVDGEWVYMGKYHPQAEVVEHFDGAFRIPLSHWDDRYRATIEAGAVPYTMIDDTDPYL